MTLLIQPPVSARELAGPDEVGRFVLIGGRIAMVCVAPQDPRKTLMLATHDGQAFQASQYTGGTVLTFGDAFVVEPELGKGVSETRPSPQASSALFADDHERYFVLLFGSDWRLVALSSGEIVRPTNEPMYAFQHWKLGVPGVQAGAPLWIFRA